MLSENIKRGGGAERNSSIALYTRSGVLSCAEFLEYQRGCRTKFEGGLGDKLLCTYFLLLFLCLRVRTISSDSFAVELAGMGGSCMLVPIVWHCAHPRLVYDTG